MVQTSGASLGERVPSTELTVVGRPDAAPGDARPAPAARRDFSLDLLRAIAIIGVMLAHSHIPGWLFQLRNFSVPLLMMLSGWSISLSMAHREVRLRSYLKRRAERLLVPTWAFLALFFGGFAIAHATGLGERHYSAKIIVSSIALLGNIGGPGIGYVWIIRVNLLNSTATPFLLRANRSCRSDSLFVAACLATIVTDTVLWILFTRSGADKALGITGDALEQTVFYLFGYGPVFALGMRLCRMPRSSILKLAAIGFGAFAFLGTCYYVRDGVVARTEIFKYPPQIYYLAYGCAMSLILIAFRARLAAAVPEGLWRNVIGFIGGNTLWIYLWHILLLVWIGDLERGGVLPDNWAVSWVCVTAVAIVFTWLQKSLADAAAARSSARTARVIKLLLG